MRRAFSFVEIVVAVAVLALVAIGVMTALSGSAREVKTTSEYSLSLFLSQKIVEDLLQTSHENPHFEEALAEIDGQRVPVERSLHPYFAGLEDTRAPFGILQPGADLAVEPADAPLYKLYREFNLTLASAEESVPAAAPPNARTVRLLYDWPGLKGTDREFRIPMTVAKAAPRQEPTPLPALDTRAMDEAICKGLYPKKSGELSTVVSQVRGKLVVVRDIGEIIELGAYAESERDKLKQQIEALEAALAPGTPEPPANAEIRVALGRLYERRAAVAWQTLLYLKDRAGRNETSFDDVDLGKKKDDYDPYYVVGRVAESADLLEGFKYDLAWSTHQYARARGLMDAWAMRSFRRMAIERKVLELLKFKILVEQSPDLSYLQSWLDNLLLVHTGRVRSFADYLVRERSRARTLRDIELAHPVLVARVSDAQAAVGSLRALEARVKRELIGR